MFEYEPWTPPASDKRPGVPPKPTVHENAITDNYAAGPDVWHQFTIGPRDSNPNDPYNASILEHTLDLVRSARRASVNLVYKVYNAATGEHVLTKTADGTTADQVLTDAGVPAIIRFNARPKRVKA